MEVPYIKFSPDGQYFASRTDNNIAKLFYTDTAKELLSIAHKKIIFPRFSPNSDYLVTRSNDGISQLFQTSANKKNQAIIADVDFIAFSPDGNYFTTRSNFTKIFKIKTIEKVKTEEEIVTIAQKKGDGTVFSANGNYLATGSEDGTAKLIQVNNGKVIRTITHIKKIKYFAFSPNSEYLVTGSKDGTLKLIKTKTGDIITSISSKNDEIYRIIFHPNKNYVAVINHGQINSVKIFKFKLDKDVAYISDISTITHKNKIWEINLSSCGEYFVTYSQDEITKLIKFRTGKEITTIPIDKYGNKIKFSPNGEHLGVYREDGSTKLIHITTGKEIINISHEDKVNNIEFSPNGDYLGTASDDGSTKLIHISTRKEIANILHANAVKNIKFSPDGEYLATESGKDFEPKDYDDGSTKLIQVSTGKEITHISHETPVRDIEFSPDGNYLATVSSNMLRMDLLNQKELIKKTCGRLSQNLRIDLWRRYFNNNPYQKTCNNLPIHPSFLREGKKLAQAGEISEAVKIFKRAKRLEPNTYNNRGRKLKTGIDLNPGTEIIDQNPRKVANKFYAPTKLEEGKRFAREVNISDAISAFKRSQKLDPKLIIDAESWNILCQNGGLNRQATKVMFACNHVVNISKDSETDTKTQAKYRDSRGLALALTGKHTEAIKDFRFYIKNSEADDKFIAKRKAWIESLVKGENPFTDEVLESLKQE